jgi:hypothetical protein
MARTTATAALVIAREELEQVVGGAVKPPWNNAMSNGCGNGIINLKNGTWRDACVRHDRDYYEGGPWALRRVADRRLYRNMVAEGASKSRAFTYWAGARVLGPIYWGGGPPRNPGSH